MSTAQDILTEFNRTGNLRFPENQVPSVRGNAIFSLAYQSVGEQVFTFADGSELLIVQDRGTLKVSLSLAYRARLALQAKAAAKAAMTSTPAAPRTCLTDSA